MGDAFSPPPVLSQPAEAQSLSPRAKVLLADNNPTAIRQAEAFLTHEGYRVISATSGREALDKIASEGPSLVLLGTTLPDMSSLEVCQRIKRDPATRFLPVVLMTSRKNEEERRRGVQIGVDDFLDKPAEREELLARVRSLLRIKMLHDALVERTQQLEEVTQEIQRLRGERGPSSPEHPQAPTDHPPLRSRVPHFKPGIVAAPRSRPQTPEQRAPSQPTSPAEAMNRQALRGFKKEAVAYLSSVLGDDVELGRTPDTIAVAHQHLSSLYEDSGLHLPDPVREILFREILDDVLGYGPIEPLLADPTVTEIMVNGPHTVYIERDGRVFKTDIQFDDDDHILHIIHRIIRPLGRRVDRDSPMVDARLPDGSRVNVIIPPCAIDGPAITIRRFGEDRLTIEDLIRLGSITPQMAKFLEACVRTRLNIIVSGGTSSGKTTLLNVLSSFIPSHERIITIEDSAELQLHQEHVVRLEAKPPDPDGKGEVTIRDLVRNALRMRPERLVVGEVRGPEALDMLQAMNTGHDGSMTTIHANSPRDTISRLETLVLMAGFDLPVKAIRAQIASAINLIIHQARLRDGSRKVVSITEVQGMESDIVVLSEIFTFEEQGMQDDRVVGKLVPTGIRPKFTPKLEAAGYTLPADIFLREGQLRLGRRGRRA